MEYMDLKSLLNFGLPNMPRTVIGLRKKRKGMVGKREGVKVRVVVLNMPYLLKSEQPS